DPRDALYPEMPRSALENVDVDHCLALADLPALLVDLASEPVSKLKGDDMKGADDLRQESDIAELKPDAVHDDERPGVPSAFACPECGGVLWELHDNKLVRFRCRVGHAWTA